MYYIYHIPGVKIGCSTEPQQRIKNQGFEYHEILEVHDDIYVASDRERELQKQWGYPVDKKPYWQSRQQWGRNASTKESCIKGAKNNWNKNRETLINTFCRAGGKKQASIINYLKVQCPYCDKISNPGAIGFHKKHCKNKQ